MARNSEAPEPAIPPLARDIAATALATAGSAGVSWLAFRYLNAQAAVARTVIPHRTDSAPNADGIYDPGATRPRPYRRGDTDYDVHLGIFGDSTAAGLGVLDAQETPGVRLARSVALETGKRVRLSTKAIVGATSRSLSGQIDAMLIAGGAPDIAVIVIGANDVTSRQAVGKAARRVGRAVSRLKAAGSEVVVGTCPDLGVVVAIPQPLRSFVREWGRRLAAAQANATRAAGGRPVPMADLLAREFLHAPEQMFSPDKYHPSAAGYELAARLLLPEVLNAIGEWGAGPLPSPPERSVAGDAAITRAARRLLGRRATDTDAVLRDETPAG